MLYYNRRQTIQRTIGTEQQAASHDRTEQLNTKNRLFSRTKHNVQGLVRALGC